MNIKIIFAVLSSIVGIFCFYPYIRDIFRKTTQPHSYTWLVWTILQTTAVIVMLASGAGLGVLSLSIGAVLCGFIFLLSLRYGTKNIKTFDLICLIGALGAIVVYLFSRNALLSMVLVTLIDFIGFLPTFRKAYEEPRTETLSTYILSAISNMLALGALVTFDITTALYLVSTVLTGSICACIIMFRR